MIIPGYADIYQRFETKGKVVFEFRVLHGFE